MENSNNSTGSRRIRRSTTSNPKSRMETKEAVSEIFKKNAYTGTDTLEPSPTGMGRTYTPFTDKKTITSEDVMNQYDVFAKRAIEINSLILKTGSKDLEIEFEKLMSEVVLLVQGVTSVNRQKWLKHGFQPEV